jgi:hypothetical protein
MDRRAHPFAQVQDHLKVVVIHAPFQTQCSFPGNYSEFPNSSIGEQLSALRQHTHMTLGGGRTCLVLRRKLLLRHPDRIAIQRQPRDER